MRYSSRISLTAACLVAILAGMEWSYADPPDPGPDQKVKDIKGNQAAYPIEFQAPEGDQWVWRLTAETADNWEHILGTQRPRSGGWNPDFHAESGFWSFAVNAQNIGVWRQFQQTFTGDLRPTGTGTGGAPADYSFTINARTDGNYFIVPTSSITGVEGNVTLQARDADDEPVPSAWDYEGPEGAIGTIEPSTGNPPSVTFSADLPGKYTIRGTAGQQTDEAAVIVVDKFVIRVDTDRNAILTTDDLDGRATWSIGRGAFIPPVHLRGTGPHSVAKIPSFDIYVQNVAHIADVTLQLRLPAESSGLRVLREDGTISPLDIGEGWSENIPSGAFSSEGIAKFRIISDTPRTASGGPNNPARAIELYTIENGVTTKVDEAKVKTAPMILPWETLPAEKVYVCNTRFPADDDLPAPLVAKIERVSFGSPWIQDKIEFAKVQCNINVNDVLDVVADLGHDKTDANTIYNYFSPKSIRYVDWRNNAGHGGDIMISPPHGIYPYGRAITGSSTSAAKHHILAQGVQGPLIELSTGWLTVGHVDELLAFVNHDTVLMACPYKASTLLHERIVGGNSTDTILFGDKPHNESEKTLRELVIAKNGERYKVGTMTQPLPEIPIGNALSDWITVPDHVFEEKDIVRFGKEIAEIYSVEQFPNNPLINSIRLMRREAYRTGMPAHPPSTKIYAYTHALRINLVSQGSTINPAWHLTSQNRQEFLTKSGGAYNVILMPVLFHMPDYRFRAATANVANCLLLYPDVYMQHPGNEHWTNYITAQMPEGVTVHFLPQPEIWNNYHRGRGSLHCGSAVRRTIVFSEAWWDKNTLQEWK